MDRFTEIKKEQSNYERRGGMSVLEKKGGRRGGIMPSMF